MIFNDKSLFQLIEYRYIGGTLSRKLGNSTVPQTLHALSLTWQAVDYLGTYLSFIEMPPPVPVTQPR